MGIIIILSIYFYFQDLKNYLCIIKKKHMHMRLSITQLWILSKCLSLLSYIILNIENLSKNDCKEL